MTYEHHVVWRRDRSRIVCIDSMGHVDDRLGPDDVVVAGSHCARAAIELVLHLRLRGLIGHAAGPGLDDNGISGLWTLEAAGVPGAAAATESAPIADGLAMHGEGTIGHVNVHAAAIGVEPGMAVAAAAELMATRRAPQRLASFAQHVVYDGPEGRAIALDTITHGDERINGTVICMGSHSGDSMADYVAGYDLRGTITNDAGDPPERSAVRGMDELAERGIPAAVVDGATARVGDGRSTYETGVVAQANEVAAALGIDAGMPASEAVRLMLATSRS